MKRVAPGDRESGMTATDFGLVGGLVLAQNTQTSQPAAPATATQGTSPGFQVPGATTGAPGGTIAPGAPTGPTSGGGGGGFGGGGLGLLMPLAVVMVLMLLMTSMTGRKERKKREALLSAIKRGDRVQTTGGIIGTVTDLTSTEMTLRVDETSNTRIRFARSAASAVLKEGVDAGGSQMEAKPKTAVGATT
jgi:preprotein translocase subunit YajC